MGSEVSRRARARAKEAHERAKEAGARAAELATPSRVASVDEIATEEAQDQAVHRSQEALDRATFLAKEGYRHAAEAQRGAARAHDAVGDTRVAHRPAVPTTRTHSGLVRRAIAVTRNDTGRRPRWMTGGMPSWEAEGPAADGAPNADDGDEA